MKVFKHYAVLVAVGLLAFAILEFLFPGPPPPETRNLNCVFRSASNGSPANIPVSSEEIRKITFEGKLSGKSVRDDTDLWHAEGTAVFQGNLQKLSGPIFIFASTGEVRGLSLYRDRYPHQMVDLRISTLDESGMLDWDEDTAFVYFESAPDKLAHHYDYHCTVENS